MTKVLIHHGEIGLKKGNFAFFEKKLVENIKKSAEKNKLDLKKIQRQEKRIIADIEADEKTITEMLKTVFGIKYFSFVCEISPKIEEMENIVREIMKKNKIKKIALEREVAIGMGPKRELLVERSPHSSDIKIIPESGKISGVILRKGEGSPAKITRSDEQKTFISLRNYFYVVLHYPVDSSRSTNH